MVIFLLKFKKMDMDTLAIREKADKYSDKLKNNITRELNFRLHHAAVLKTSPNNGKNDGIDSAATATAK